MILSILSAFSWAISISGAFFAPNPSWTALSIWGWLHTLKSYIFGIVPDVLSIAGPAASFAMI
jgi:predicted membrane-bound dolichyl-phosphate-mannose-protein mannosyltransferase